MFDVLFLGCLFPNVLTIATTISHGSMYLFVNIFDYKWKQNVSIGYLKGMKIWKGQRKSSYLELFTFKLLLRIPAFQPLLHNVFLRIHDAS